MGPKRRPYIASFRRAMDTIPLRGCRFEAALKDNARASARALNVAVVSS
jgi:hypothetical protein